MGVEGWKEVNLGEFVTLKRGFDLPVSKRKKGKYPILASNGVTDFHNEYKVPGPGVITGRSGTLGQVHFSKNDFWPLNTTLYVEDYHNNNILFAYYFLKTLHLENYNAGSSVPTLNRNHVHSLTVTIPPLQEQKQIAAILSALDEKIELNHRINQNLEAMAQALFQSWFVDFEPFQDGEFVESELGWIPKEWKVRKLGDIINITSGKRPTNKAEQQNKKFNVALIGASSITGYVDQALYKEPILVTGRVGTHGVIQRVRGESWPSDNTLVIKTPYYEFVYQILKTLDYKSMNRGSTQPLITQRDIKNTQIVFPSDLVLSDFENQTKALYNLVNEFNDEIKTLSQLRDTLLPKLMSGEIRVPLDEKEAAHERADGNEAG